jgi:phospholipase/lecithinase/hemolysin
MWFADLKSHLGTGRLLARNRLTGGSLALLRVELDGRVTRWHPLVLIVWLLGMTLLQAQAGYSSLYIFGDGLSTTTNNPSSLTQSYYGKRRCNGRVWVEVLAQRQGIGISNNWSYFDCNSSNLVTNVGNFAVAQSLATNALFVIWVNNSDLYDEAVNDGTDLAKWTAAINRSQTNHFRAITNLYAKGLRTLIVPNAVDISTVPYFNGSASTNFIRQECRVFNTNFATTLNGITSATNTLGQLLYPGLKIYSPDYFTLLYNVLTNAANYGLTNVTFAGLSIDALDAVNYGFPVAATNGYGTNYIFWDQYDPTAKFHAVIADVAQQLVAPAQIVNLAMFTGSNQLDVVNLPVGLNGFVVAVADMSLTNWAVKTSFNSTNVAQSIFVPSAEPPSFYRLFFPYAWSWP